MVRRQLDVTARTTLERVEVRVLVEDSIADALGVLDVESPEGEAGVHLGLELDPDAVDCLDPHADVAVLTPEQARTLAAELEEVADATERGESVRSGRG